MRKFKECTVWGNMLSDKASEQYPTVPVCESCIEQIMKVPGQETIVSVGGDLGQLPEEECYFADGRH